MINAHYTDPAIATEVWGALTRLGFAGGRVLEPGSGAGTFIGLAPDGAQTTGVELDLVTAAISQAVYPDATIRTESFADTRMPAGTFDAAVGNVPFSKNVLHDPRHNAAGHSMHNHFILKSLALTRPGGVVGVISSAFTLDAQNPAARREMAETADLLGAVRLPTGAHRRAAGTDALTDVLIFRRRLPGEEPLDQSWVEADPVELDDQQGRMNAYFLAHPERVLGEPVIGNGMYGSATLTVRAEDLAATGARLHEQLADITEQALTAGRRMVERTSEQELEAAALVPATDQEQVGHITAQGDGTFTQVTLEGVHATLPVPTTPQAELRALLGLRDQGRAVLTLEAAKVEDTPELEAMREQLRTTYLSYYDRYGAINRFTERRTGKYDEAGADILARITPPAVRLLRGGTFGPLVLGMGTSMRGRALLWRPGCSRSGRCSRAVPCPGSTPRMRHWPSLWTRSAPWTWPMMRLCWATMRPERGGSWGGTGLWGARGSRGL